jgi:sugar O-acyltransferase (sialic acid O-acetyltransferase NeuD family)
MQSEPVVLIGAGGHAKMVIEACRSASTWRLIACMDREPRSTKLLGVDVIDESETAIEQAIEAGQWFFVAIGENAVRGRVSHALAARGAKFATVIAASAYVSRSATVGPGTVIMPNAAIGAATTIGSGCIINTSASIDHDGQIESFAHIAPGTHIAGNVRVGAGAMLGIGCSVIPGIEIGEWAMVGAGSTLIRNIPARSKWVGSPARCIDPS